MRTKNTQKGFSLIELLIVVAIILIIAAIAIPNLLRSRMAANEASAVGSLRTLNTAAVQYNTTYGLGFPTALSALGPAATASRSVPTIGRDRSSSIRRWRRRSWAAMETSIR